MKLHFMSKDLTKTGKKQFKSSVQYFHGILCSLTWCHSARLIEWYVYELLMTLRNEFPCLDTLIQTLGILLNFHKVKNTR